MESAEVRSGTHAVRGRGCEHNVGAVPARASALLDEREDGSWRAFVQTPIPFRHVMFLPAEHLGITQDPTFRDNVLYWLLEEPRGSAPNR